MKMTHLKTFAYLAAGLACVVLFAKAAVCAWIAVVLIAAPFWLIYSLPGMARRAIARFAAYCDGLDRRGVNRS